MNKDDKKKIAELINDIIKGRKQYIDDTDILIEDFLRIIDHIQDELTIMITTEECDK